MLIQTNHGLKRLEILWDRMPKRRASVQQNLFAVGEYQIPADVSYGTVTALGLDFTPTFILPTITRNRGKLNLSAWIIEETISRDSFDFELSGVTDGTFYWLRWLAIG